MILSSTPKGGAHGEPSPVACHPRHMPALSLRCVPAHQKILPQQSEEAHNKVQSGLIQGSHLSKLRWENPCVERTRERGAFSAKAGLSCNFVRPGGCIPTPLLNHNLQFAVVDEYVDNTHQNHIDTTRPSQK